MRKMLRVLGACALLAPGRRSVPVRKHDSTDHAQMIIAGSGASGEIAGRIVDALKKVP